MLRTEVVAVGFDPERVLLLDEKSEVQEVDVSDAARTSTESVSELRTAKEHPQKFGSLSFARSTQYGTRPAEQLCRVLVAKSPGSAWKQLG